MHGGLSILPRKKVPEKTTDTANGENIKMGPITSQKVQCNVHIFEFF